MDLLTTFALTIRLYDVTGVPPAIFQQALAVASSTLREAGVDVQWALCPANEGAATAAPRCQELLAPNELVLRVRNAAGKTGPHTLGDAIVDTRIHAGSMATLYADRVVAAAANSGAEIGVVLGRAMVHEVGHLLLGRRDHATAGLMRAHWTAGELRQSSRRDWRFSAVEISEIRSGLNRRTVASENTGH